MIGLDVLKDLAERIAALEAAQEIAHSVSAPPYIASPEDQESAAELMVLSITLQLKLRHLMLLDAIRRTRSPAGRRASRSETLRLLIEETHGRECPETHEEPI